MKKMFFSLLVLVSIFTMSALYGEPLQQNQSSDQMSPEQVLQSEQLPTVQTLQSRQMTQSQQISQSTSTETSPSMQMTSPSHNEPRSFARSMNSRAERCASAVHLNIEPFERLYANEDHIVTYPIPCGLAAPCGLAGHDGRSPCSPCVKDPCTGANPCNPCPISIPYPTCLNIFPSCDSPCDKPKPLYSPPCVNPPCFRYPPCYNPHDAFDLVTIYALAVCNDATLQAAKEAQLAARELLPQASAQFLPVIQAQTQHLAAYNNGGNIFFTQNGLKVGGYNSNTYALSLTQPILHFEHWKKYEQACAQVKQANATYIAAEQDLMVRSATAYFNVLKAFDTLYYARAQVEALGKFYDQTLQRFRVGLIPITDVQIAKASHDSAVAQEIIAQTDIANKYEALREIVGVCVEYLVPLKPEFNLVKPDPDDIESWACAAVKQNFTLQAQRFQTAAARDNIKINEFGHLPFVDVLGSSIFTNPTNQIQFANNTSTLTLQVTLPLFSGGAVLSKTRQARHTYLQTDKQTEALYRNVESQTRQFYRNVVTQISQVAAFKQAVISNRAALEATSASFNVGTRTIVDVLNAQTGLIQALLNLAVAKYTYITDSIQLKRSAGVLCPEDFCHINTWLQQGKVTGQDLKNLSQTINVKFNELQALTAQEQTPATPALPNSTEVPIIPGAPILRELPTTPAAPTPPPPSPPPVVPETPTTVPAPPSLPIGPVIPGTTRPVSALPQQTETMSSSTTPTTTSSTTSSQTTLPDLNIPSSLENIQTIQGPIEASDNHQLNHDSEHTSMLELEKNENEKVSERMAAHNVQLLFNSAQMMSSKYGLTNFKISSEAPWFSEMTCFPFKPAVLISSLSLNKD